MQGLTLTCRSRTVAIGAEVCDGKRFGVYQMRIEGQEQRGAFLDNADPGVSVAVNATLVPFGLSKPALQLEVVLWHVHVLTPNKQPRGKAGHDVAHMLPDRIVTLLELLLQDLKLHLTLGTGPALRLECRLHRPDVLYLGTNDLLCVVHCRQAPIDTARYTREALVRRPPFFTSRFRCSEAWTSSKASAMRSPGGCKGPPWSSFRMPRTAAQ
jgi:hypothetical protein